MKKGWIIAIIVFILLGLIGSCDSGDAGSYIDWGDGYYWDSSEHTVKKTIW